MYREDFQGELIMPAFLMEEIYKIYFRNDSCYKIPSCRHVVLIYAVSRHFFAWEMVKKVWFEVLQVCWHEYF